MTAPDPPVAPDICRTCGAPRRRGRGTAVEVASPTGEVTARLEGVAAWVCESRHVEAIDPTLVPRLRGAVSTQLVTAQRRRLRRDDACGRCGQALTMPGRRTETPVVDDSGPDVVTLSPTMVMVRCPACGTEQVPHGVAMALDALLPVLVRAATEPPPT